MSVSSLVLPVLLVLLCGSSRAYYDQQMQRLADPEDAAEGAEAYLLPPLPPKYRPHGNWEPAPDPRLYILTEEDLDEDQAARRVKRNNSPNLSIVNSLDVLRQRLLLEMARRRMRQSEGQINANREILNSLGKREISQSELAGLNTDMRADEMVHASSAGTGNSRSRLTTDSDWSAPSRGQRKQL